MLNVALAGFGLAGKTFHAPLIAACSDLKLTKVLSSQTQEVKAIYPNTQVVNEFKDLLTEEIDLVVIATPNHLHFEQAQMAIKAKKAVVVDKPFTTNFQDALTLKRLAKEHGVVLSVFHNRRFDGDFLTIKKLLDENKLGDIVYFESNFNRFRPEVNFNNWREKTKASDGGGLFNDLAPHLIDQVLHLFGKPQELLLDQANLRKEALVDDYFHLILRYPDKRVHLNASTTTKNPRERFVVHGLKGSFLKHGLDPQEQNLKNGMLANNELIGEDKPEFFGALELNEVQKIPTMQGNYKLYYQNISDVLQKKADLFVSVDDALDVMHIMEQARISFDEQKWIKYGV